MRLSPKLGVATTLLILGGYAVAALPDPVPKPISLWSKTNSYAEANAMCQSILAQLVHDRSACPQVSGNSRPDEAPNYTVFDSNSGWGIQTYCTSTVTVVADARCGGSVTTLRQPGFAIRPICNDGDTLYWFGTAANLQGVCYSCSAIPHSELRWNTQAGQYKCSCLSGFVERSGKCMPPADGTCPIK